MIPWEPTKERKVELPARQADEGYVRPPEDIYTYVPDHAAALEKG